MQLNQNKRRANGCRSDRQIKIASLHLKKWINETTAERNAPNHYVLVPDRNVPSLFCFIHWISYVARSFDCNLNIKLLTDCRHCDTFLFLTFFHQFEQSKWLKFKLVDSVSHAQRKITNSVIHRVPSLFVPSLFCFSNCFPIPYPLNLISLNTISLVLFSNDHWKLYQLQFLVSSMVLKTKFRTQKTFISFNVVNLFYGKSVTNGLLIYLKDRFQCSTLVRFGGT